MLPEKGRRVIITSLIALLTISLLGGVYYFYNQYFIKQPLSYTLQQSQLIEDYSFTKKGDIPLLKIKLKKVEDLNVEFEKFIDGSGELLDKEIRIEIHSKPNDRLKECYYEISPALYEAISLNNYTQLQKYINEINKYYKFDKAQLIVTNNYILLQFEDCESYLYSIFNRKENNFPKIINKLGSDIK